MRLGSGRLAEPTLAPSPGFGGGRSWNSSDYNDIDEFLARMGRRPRPASGAVPRDRPSGSKRKASTTFGTGPEVAPLPQAEPSPADGEKVAQPLQPMPTLKAAEPQATPVAAEGVDAASLEATGILPQGSVYRPGTKIRRRKAERTSRAKGTRKATARARVESETEPPTSVESVASAVEVKGSADAPSCGDAPTADECPAKPWTGTGARNDAVACSDDGLLAMQALVGEQATIAADAPTTRPETAPKLALLDPGDPAAPSATDESFDRAVARPNAEPSNAEPSNDGSSNDGSSPATAVPGLVAEERATPSADSDAETGAPLSDSAHLRAQIDAVMSAPLVRDAVTPLPATTVRALLPRPTAHSSGHRSRRLLAIAVVLCAAASSVAAWLVRPEVLFGAEGLLTTAALRLGGTRLPAAAVAAAMPPAPSAPPQRAVAAPLAPGSTAVADTLEAPPAAVDMEPHLDSTISVVPMKADPQAARTIAPEAASAGAAPTNASERVSAAVPASGGAGSREPPRAQPGADEAAPGAASLAMGASAGAQRMRVTADGVLAEIVEAVPEPPLATALGGHTFVPPKPLAASSPLPEGLGVDGTKGRVFLNVTVGVDGTTEAIEIVDAPRGDKALSSAVVSALQQWRFRPAELDGEQVASRLLVVVEQR